MAEPAPKHGMTVGEFLAYDDGTETRYELVGGEMIAMNPPAEMHVRIAMNVYDSVARRPTRPCRAYMGGGVWHNEEDNTWREPDIFISCEPEGFSWTPRAMIEILSPSTEREDRTRKLDFYPRLLDRRNHPVRLAGHAARRDPRTHSRRVAPSRRDRRRDRRRDQSWRLDPSWTRSTPDA